MKLDCLVVRQPYASLIAFGHKRWEFRKYDSRKKGLIGILASPNNPLPVKDFALNRIRSRLPRGILLATAEMTGSFFIGSADIRSKITDPVAVNLHGFEITTVSAPVGEPMTDVQAAAENRSWQSYAWALENVKPVKTAVMVEKLERSTWITIEVPKNEERIA